MGDHTSNQVSSVSQPSITPDVARRPPKNQRIVFEHNHRKTIITVVDAAARTTVAAAAVQCTAAGASAETMVGRELTKAN